MISNNSLMIDTLRSNAKTYQPTEIKIELRTERKTKHQSPPHCEWCASQGLSPEDDDLFDMQFKTIVGAMRRNEGRFSSNHRLTPSQGGSSTRSFAEQGESREAILSAYGYTSWTRWGLAQSALALVVLTVIGMFFLDNKAVAPSNFADLTLSTYSTTTGSLNADVTKGCAIWSAFGAQNHNPVLLWHGDWSDEFALLQGQYNHCNWLKLSGDTLASETGLVLYNSRAPELDVARNMRRLRDKVCKYYQAYGHYPNSTEDLDSDRYLNPISGRRQSYKVKQVINGAIVSPAPKAEVNPGANTSGLQDNDKQPGSVWAVNVKSDPLIADDYNSYNWRNNSFYIYGNDRRGHLIAGGAAGKNFIIALKNGQDITDVHRATLAREGDKVGLYTGTKPDPNNIRWRYSFLAFSLFLLAAATAVRTMHLHLSDAKPARSRISGDKVRTGM